MNGHIVKWSPNGEKFEGMYVDGKRNGKGLIPFKNGETIAGDWVDNEITGKFI